MKDLREIRDDEIRVLGNDGSNNIIETGKKIINTIY